MRDLAWFVLVLCAAATNAPGFADSAPPRLENPFFVFCHDTHDAKRRDLAQQAEMISQLGFDGVGHVGLDNLPERLTTLDAKGLKLFFVFAHASIDPQQPKYDPRLPEAVKLLQGREAVLGLLVRGGEPSDPAGDDRAVALVREIADLAGAAGVRVALYPHTDYWLEKTSDAVRVARKVGRDNVGVMFNLCHWLKVDDTSRLKETLAQALPYLFAVSINGADPPPGGWERLIQPLGSGSFDVASMLRTLHELGYKGPVGLMCYGLRGDAKEHLAKSMAAWNRLAVEAARAR